MKGLHIIIYIGTLMMGFALAGCNGCGGKKEHELPKAESVILSNIKQKADLVTTEVRVRKLAIYDSSKHEKFELKDPRTWKYGERKCIVPVDVTIKYGYDLRDLTMDDVRLTDDSTAVVILLPEPKVIDSGYEAKVDEKAIVRMSSGLRDKISHEEVDQLMERAYREVMKEDFTELVGKDIENNAKVVFASIVKSVGMKNVDVIVHRKEEWKR
ncbi:MAG: DUF4230 domain-containing protein [Bacteroidaceae bacterium]|nr:DUF4230 domain-containing protein [Bacteroidaceae bacterium]